MAEDYAQRGATKTEPIIKIIDEPIEDRLRYIKGATSFHQKIISRLTARRRLSERFMLRRYDAWNSVDENCRLFIDLSRPVKKGDGSVDTSKKEIPWARSIVMPMSYAILQVYLTQLVGIFTRRDPPMEIQGVRPEDVRPAVLMNAVLGYDQIQTNYILELYTAAQDAMKYGMGGFHDAWHEEHGWKTERYTGWQGWVAQALGMDSSQRVWGRRRQYNMVEAWDPYNFFPDPRISLSKLQRSEFCSFRLWLGYLEILANARENGGLYFNVQAIPQNAPKPAALRSRNRWQAAQMNLVGSMDERDKGFHAVDSMVVNLIPREWELGISDKPEKWQFTWVDDRVIIRAHRADYDHEEFNFSALESNIDTHVFSNQGSIENLDGLQRFGTWMLNSQIQNVIRFLNNRMIYDPFMVESYDVENPDAAMHIRLTAPGSQALREGRLTIPQMIQQMQLTDVTSGMLGEVSFLMDLAMRMSGAADAMMGKPTPTKRTLGEITNLTQGASARMSMHAMMMDMQGIRPMALRWCSNRQQYTDEDMYVKIGGALAAEYGSDRIKVKPSELYGNYEYVARTGPEPPDPGSLSQTLFQGLAMIMKTPGILTIPDRNGKMLDIHEFVREALRDRGVRNVDEYYRSIGGLPGQTPPGAEVKVLPDEQVQKLAQQGNVVPMSAARKPMVGR